MQISGTILSIVPDGGYQSQQGYVYTFQMGINTPAGVYTGQIGSKTQAYPLAVGQSIVVDMTNSNKGVRFKKINPQYATNAPQQPNTPAPPPQTPQQPKAPAPQNGLDKTSFAMAYAKDLVVAGKIPLLNMYKVAMTMLEFMTTGKHPFDLPDYDGKTESGVVDDDYNGRTDNSDIPM